MNDYDIKMEPVYKGLDKIKIKEAKKLSNRVNGLLK